MNLTEDNVSPDVAELNPEHIKRSSRRGRHKYGAITTTIDGIRFDSKAEARRYTILKAMQEAGDISQLELQPKFELLPKFECRGERIRAVNYIADFQYIDASGRTIVEDVKGVETPVFKLKRKLFLKKFPNLKLEIVT